MKEIFIVSENTEYKIDQLIEEGLFSSFQNKIEDIITKVDKKISTKGEIERLAKKEKESHQRRLEYLKKYDIDIGQFKRDLKAGKDIKISFSHLMDELKGELKDIGKPEDAKMLAAVVILMAVNTAISIILTPIIGNPLQAGAIGALIMAPISEEIYKRFGAKKRANVLGFLSFNIGERYVQYSHEMENVLTGSIHADWSAYWIMQLLIMVMHAVTTSIHIKGKIRDDYKKDFSIETKDKNEYKNKASKLSGIIHAVFNFRPSQLGL